MEAAHLVLTEKKTLTGKAWAAIKKGRKKKEKEKALL